MTKLLANEREIRLARQHWAVFLPTVLVLLAVAVVTAVILVLLPRSVSGHDIGTVKAVIGLVIGLFVVGAFLLRYLRWRYTTYVLTDKRILLSRGILSRYTESITLDRIQDTAISQSLIGRMFKAGTVEIESAGRDGTEMLHRVPRAEATAFGCIDSDESGRIKGFIEKPADPPGIPDNLDQTFVSMGNYIFTTKVLIDQDCAAAK